MSMNGVQDGQKSRRGYMKYCNLKVAAIVILALLTLYVLATYRGYVSEKKGWKKVKELLTSLCSENNEKMNTVKVISEVDLSKEKGTKKEVMKTENRNLERRLPKAIMIGSKKCGTGALITHLNRHPDIVTPFEMGAHYFDDKFGDFSRGVQWYRDIMPRSFPDQITIEKSPSYFITWDVPKRVLEFNESLKLILIVRDPVKRSISDYVHIKNKTFALKGYRKNYPSFEKFAINATTGEVNGDWIVINTSRYSEHMERWLKVFPRKQIHVVNGDRYPTNPVDELKKIELFLGVQRWFKDEHFKFNPKRGFMCENFDGHMTCMGKEKGRKHPDVKPAVIKKLTDYFKPYNKKFHELVGNTFGW